MLPFLNMQIFKNIYIYNVCQWISRRKRFMNNCRLFRTFFHFLVKTINTIDIAGNVGRGEILSDLAVWKITPNLYPPIFCLTYQARVSSSIVCRCRCFVTLKRCFLSYTDTWVYSIHLLQLSRSSGTHDILSQCLRE